MMLDNREKIIKSIQVYINENMSDYAIMINGAWGSGKTYFVKNELIPELEQDRPVIYISLFGIKTIDDLVNVMSLHILNIYSNERAQKRANLNGNNFRQINSGNISSTSKVATTLMSLVSKGLKLVPKGEDTKAFVSDLQKNSIKFNRYIFIFDDFERSIIDKIELLGFFDELVEQNNAKVIIVCNESKITNAREEKSANNAQQENNESDDKRLVDDYRLYKEKVIGLTIKYEANLYSVYETVLMQETNNDNTCSLLLQYKNNILELFKIIHSINIRTLIFTFKRCKELCKEIESVFKTNKKDMTYFDEYVVIIMLNVVTASLSYKDLGKNILDILKNKDTIACYFSSEGLNDNVKNFDMTNYVRVSRFVNKYIYSYSLDYKLLKEDIDRYIEEKVNDTQDIANKVNNIFNIEDDECAVRKLLAVLDDIEKNKYCLGVYPRILSNLFILVDLFSDGKQISTDKLKKSILANIEKRADEFIESNWYYFSSSNIEANEFNHQLYKTLKSMHNKARISRFIKDFNSVDDVVETLRKFVEIGSAAEKGKSLLSYVPVEIIVKRVMKASNNEIQAIHGILRYNYLNVNNIKDIRQGDLCMFRKWRDMLDQQKDTIDSQLKYFHICLLLDCIKDICDKLQ